ncbi:bifunctional glycosyltransferase/CDP-glycerol:glycerophosphate glycerophosphotransferase [Pimelobacter simplex]|uniref:bifunctional glycosyltransferase/CDP-glycerol:glycerophosphate glycerophosphotransferase n=1 Tax=Nocardioides simplex TaxID=2045 RepID=UPI003AAA259B
MTGGASTLAAAVRRRAARLKQASGLARPTLSVVVAALDSAEHVGACLESLRRQEVPDTEILVVDLGSTDRTREIVAEHQAEDSRVRLLTATGDRGWARDHGASAARGRYLAFVDADDAVTRHGLRFAVEALRESGASYAVAAERPQRRGRVLPVGDDVRRLHDARRRLSGDARIEAALHGSATRSVFDREWYAAAGLAFGAGRAVDATHAARAAYAAEAVEWLPHVLALRRTDDDRSVLTRASATEVAADVATAVTLLGTDGPRRAAVALGHDLLGFLPGLWPADPAVWTAVRAAVVPLVAEAGAAAEPEVPSWAKVLHGLLVADDAAGANRFLEGVRRSARQYPVTDGTVDFGAGAGVGAARVRLGAVETLVRAELTSVRTTDGSIELTGWAFVDNTDLSGPDDAPGIELTLVARDGREVTLPIRRRDEPEADVASGLHHADVTPSGFTARAELGELGDGTWDLWASVTHGTTAHRGRVVVRPRTMAGVPAAAAGPRLLVLDHDDLERAELRVSTPAAWLGPAAVDASDDGRLLLDLDARLAWLRRAGSDERVRLSRVDGRFAVPLDELGGPGRFELVVAHGTQVRHVHHHPDAPVTAHLRPDRRGRVCVVPPARGALVTAVRLTDDAVEADLLIDDRPPDWRVALVDGGLVVPGTLTPTGRGTATARVPLTASVWGQPATCLRAGHYTLSLANARHTDWFGAAPSPATNAALPLAELRTDYRVRIDVAHPDGPVVGVVVEPPLADDERGERRQRLLREACRVERAEQDSVFLRAMFGEHAHGNGLGLHDELVRRGSDLTVYWSIADRSVVVPEGGIGVVERTRAWHQAIATSRFHMVDVHQVRWFERPAGQTLIQTFHGYPYKLMGHDWWEKMGNDPAEVGSLDRRTRDWSVLVSPARYASPLLKKAFLDPADADDVPVDEIGYPRNDILLRPEGADLRDRTRALLGIDDDTVAVLYAPTFRDYLSADDLTARRVTFFDPDEALAALPDNHVILMRGHAFNARVRDDRVATGGRVIDVTDHPDVNHLILASDAGVLDYSSLRFDYALTDKPMVFLVPDLATYDRFRGGVIPYAPTAPGPQVDTTAEVVAWLRDLPRLSAEFADARATFRRDYAELDDGYAAARLVDRWLTPPS